MVSPGRWLVPLAVSAFLVTSMVVIGTQAPAGIQVVPRPADPPLPPEPEEAPAPIPESISFSGLIGTADPTRVVFGPDPILWRESCHRLDLGGVDFDHATLSLLAGATQGELEDLDLYAYDEGRGWVAERAGASTGIGLHHEMDIPDGTDLLYTCLAGGARAEYDVIVS